MANLEIGGLSLSGLSIGWDKGLALRVKRGSVAVDPAAGWPQDLSLLRRLVQVGSWGGWFVSSVRVEELDVQGMQVFLLLVPGGSQVRVRGRGLDLVANMSIGQEGVVIDISKAVSRPLRSSLSGQIRIDTGNDRATASLSLSLAGALPLTVDVSVDSRQVSFQGRGLGEISTITPLVDLFGLDWSVQKWITGYLRGDQYVLKSFAGSFPWQDPGAVFDTFVAEFRVKGCQYTFAPGLASIKTDYTDFFMNNGVLRVIPHNSSFYGQGGGRSWLQINFNDLANIFLTAHIKVQAQIDQDIVTLLQYYDIPLPFSQQSGRTSADITLEINLNSEEVMARGVFLLAEGDIVFQQKIYGVKDARVLLENEKITIEALQLSLEQIFRADVTGSYDAATENGDFELALQQVVLPMGESNLVLETSESSPKIHYTMTSEGARIAVESSSWRIGALPLKLGPFSTPLSSAQLAGSLPSTTLSCPPFGATEISGTFSIAERSLDLRCDLLQYQGQGLQLEEEIDALSVRYDKALLVRSNTESQWLVGGVPVTLFPFEIKLSEDGLLEGSGRIRFGKFFDSGVTGQYDLGSGKGLFVLDDLDIKDETVGHFLTPGNALSVAVDASSDTLRLKVPELDMDMSSRDGRWLLSLRDLGAVYRHSPLLQRYLIKNGSVAIRSKLGGGYRVSATLPYGYPLLLKDDQAITTYQIDGTFAEKGGHFIINGDMALDYDEGLRLTTRGLSFNVPGVLQLLEDLPRAADLDSKGGPGIPCSIKATSGSLVLGPGRQLLADELNLDYRDGRLHVRLQHGAGTMSMDVEGEEFSAVGEGLNDVFMNALLPGSAFRTGTMRGAAKGRFDEFTALVKIEKTILWDFKTLNNVLALVNTLPALVTFSLPSYSSEGLPVDEIAAGMKVTKGVVSFNALNLESPELSIVGNGWVDVPQRKIAMDLNLITGAKKNMSKIPLVGYILVGKKKRPSITVKVTGDLLDPTVEYSTFQEVAIEPFYMLYRTLSLPAYLVAPIFGLDEEGQGQQEEQGGGMLGKEQEGEGVLIPQ